MAQPVWVLSVDLQTKTATFQSGMAEAAKSAKGAFSDIKQGSGEMGREVGASMGEARHGVMLLGEEFGVHLPRGITTFIASIGPVGAAMEAAFPFLAIILGATLFLEHLVKIREEAEKTALDQERLGTAVNNSFNALQQKILEAGIRADDLNKNHLAALHKQLELIDRQSMDELVHSFDQVAKAADTVFAGLKTHWYEAGIGSEGAQHALTQFKADYESLLAQGKSKDAADLLSGTLASAERVLAMQKQYNDSQVQYGNGQLSKPTSYGDGTKFAEAELALQLAGVGVTEREVQSQQALVDTLRAQVGLQGKVNELKTLQTNNAKTTTGRAVLDDSYKALKEQMDADKAAQEQEDRDQEEAHNRAIARLENGEREKIAATKQGSQARLDAIDAAVKQEEKYGLQETSFYQSLGVQRIEVIRQMAEEEARIKEEAGKEAAQHAEKMAALDVAAETEAAKVRNSSRRVTQQELIDQDIHFADEEYALQLQAINKQIAALDKSDKDYSNKLKALYDKQEEMERQHQNTLTQIADRGEIERNARILAAEQKMRDEMAKDLTSVLMRHQSFAAMMLQIGDQVATGLMESAIKYALTLDANKRHEAAAAARMGWIAGMKLPFPVNIVMAPALAASGFESVMAFAQGGIVPGVGRGDTVPAVLTPGEHVADKELTEGLRGMVRSGGANARPAIHVRAHFAPVINAIDADGVDDVLTKHQGVFQRHFETALRKANQ